VGSLIDTSIFVAVERGDAGVLAALGVLLTMRNSIERGEP
jgi:hypothetical protein